MQAQAHPGTMRGALPPIGRNRLSHALGPATCLLCLSVVQAVSPLPSAKPPHEEDITEVKVNQSKSVQTQLPSDYYELKAVGDNLGEILRGNLIQPTTARAIGATDTNKTCKENPSRQSDSDEEIFLSAKPLSRRQLLLNFASAVGWLVRR